MILCPVASWKRQRPNFLALTGMTYLQFDELICSLCSAIQPIQESVLAFIPGQSPIDLALFFAAWRMGKAVYPISFRHPPQAVQERITLTKAALVNPAEFSLKDKLDVTKIDPNCLGTLIETSSANKIVCHLLKSHLLSAQVCAEALNLKMGDTYCLNLPLFHISGIALMLRCFTVGATLVFAENAKMATHISMVPTQLFRMLNQKQAAPNLKCLLVGGAPLSQHLYDRAIKEKLPIYRSYGMTETSSMVIVQPPEQSTTILSHFQLKLSEENEILLQSDSLFHHYFGKKPIEGYFATGDIAHINDHGTIEIVGRKDRQFISGGENIIPEEIEQALLKFSSILEARVEPEPDPEFGMRPVAKLFCKNEISITQIQEKLEQDLPRYKNPKKFILSNRPISTKEFSLTKIFI